MGLASAPSVCAGLRQTLLHGWQQGFPLRPSPYQELAVRSGATLREVLSLCQRLNQEGQLDSVHACWGARLRRSRALLGFVGPLTDDAVTQLMALPACVGLERVTLAPKGWPSWWITLEGRCDAALNAQLARLPTEPDLRLPLSQAGNLCDCADGPCADTHLAHAVEDGLPLVAHPYQRLAEQLGRSERQVLARLRDWQARGDLQTLSLGAPHHAPWHACASAWVNATLSGQRLQALRALPGMQAVETPGAGAPAPLALRLHAPQDLAATLLQQTLDNAGLAGRVVQCWEGRYCAPRPSPQLFGDEEAQRLS